ncbi:thiopeptide-type bacteriocin biosynthesis protein [Pedobacter sp. NJ-S-72]
MVWNELKDYIHESSPSFFEMIKDYDYSDLQSLEPKIRFTIWKYFNRAKFRATPYGNFAAFSVIPVSYENSTAPVTLSKQHIVHRFINWQEKENLNFDSKWLIRHAGFLTTNTTAYTGGDELRYINTENGSFELSAIGTEETTQSTLDYCRTKRTVKEIQFFLRSEYSLSPAMTNYFLEQLVSFQLLITNFQPNIIGPDYYGRIGYTQTEKKNDYIIAERKRIKGQLSERRLQILTELIEFLSKHTEINTNSSLDDFRHKFKKKFEHKEVPLQIAMDPEIGIGYRSMTVNQDEGQLINDLKKKNRSYKQTYNIPYTPLYQFMLNQMIQQKTVQLNDFKDSGTFPQLPLPNTMSVLLQCTDEHLIIGSLGGCTANSLLGRFSLASEEVTKIGQRFVQIEQEANPGILFFDIGYQIEKHADNINRRKAIYDYELPILSWPESKHILALDDIMVSVRGEELVLHSVKHGKRMIPKLASAYNYARSDLPVYRFLSDIQHQGLRTSLGINLSGIFPGLLHYPRVQYKNVILSPEKWLVPKSVCQESSSSSLTELYNWLRHINLQNPFKCGDGDQTLIFKPEIEEDMHYFMLFCRNKKELYIEETFIPVIPQVIDENNEPYFPEFIVNIEHKELLYIPYPLRGLWNSEQYFSNLFLPGEEWLYFEIYCHSSKSNALLLHISRHFIFPFRKKIKKWFFIRYNDPADHIRLRFQLKEIKDGHELTASLSDLIAPYITSGIVADLQLKIYRQETERYGLERMNLVETCFGIDSDFTLTIITKPFEINDLYILSITLIENVLNNAGYTLEEQLQYAERMHINFAAEFEIQSEGTKKINQSYKDFNFDAITIALNKLQKKKAMQTAHAFLNTLQACKQEEKNSVLSDLFHMHTNRLFHDNQRMHEMIMYNFLTKRIKMKIGKLKNQFQPV